MKKIARTLCMIAVVALAFTSCKKQNENVQSFVFNAETEQLVNDEGNLEKVYLNGNSVAFEQEDKVFLFEIDSASGQGSSRGRYKLQGSTLVSDGGYVDNQTDGNYYAFYPGENVSAANFEDHNKATFTLDAIQNDRRSGGLNVPKGALYMAAKDEVHKNLSESQYNFKNICGILSLQLYNPQGLKVTSIDVVDKHFNLVGDVTLKVHAVDPVRLTTLFNNYSNPAYAEELASYLQGELGYSVANKSNKVTLDCTKENSAGVTLGKTKATATRFYIVMRPLALMQGCDIYVHFNGGTTCHIESFNDNMIRPNVIKNISATMVAPN